MPIGICDRIDIYRRYLQPQLHIGRNGECTPCIGNKRSVISSMDIMLQRFSQLPCIAGHFVRLASARYQLSVVDSLREMPSSTPPIQVSSGSITFGGDFLFSIPNEFDNSVCPTETKFMHTGPGVLRGYLQSKSYRTRNVSIYFVIQHLTFVLY